jgi:hypothetical protein
MTPLSITQAERAGDDFGLVIFQTTQRNKLTAHSGTYSVHDVFLMANCLYSFVNTQNSVNFTRKMMYLQDILGDS